MPGVKWYDLLLVNDVKLAFDMHYRAWKQHLVYRLPGRPDIKNYIKVDNVDTYQPGPSDLPSGALAVSSNYAAYDLTGSDTITAATATTADEVLCSAASGSPPQCCGQLPSRPAVEVEDLPSACATPTVEEEVDTPVSLGRVGLEAMSLDSISVAPKVAAQGGPTLQVAPMEPDLTQPLGLLPLPCTRPASSVAGSVQSSESIGASDCTVEEEAFDFSSWAMLCGQQVLSNFALQPPAHVMSCDEFPECLQPVSLKCPRAECARVGGQVTDALGACCDAGTSTQVSACTCMYVSCVGGVLHTGSKTQVLPQVASAPGREFKMAPGPTTTLSAQPPCAQADQDPLSAAVRAGEVACMLGSCTTGQHVPMPDTIPGLHVPTPGTRVTGAPLLLRTTTLPSLASSYPLPLPHVAGTFSHLPHTAQSMPPDSAPAAGSVRQGGDAPY